MIATISNLPAGPVAAMMRAAYERAAAEGRMVVLEDGRTWSYKTPAQAAERVSRGATLATQVKFA